MSPPTPRRLTLWIEPVIAFAAVARLIRDHGWPPELVGTQPRSWAFDLAAHAPADRERYLILCEVKKSVKEAEALISDLGSLSRGDDSTIKLNSRKKWNALLIEQPPILWIVGPAPFSKVFNVTYTGKTAATFEIVPGDRLAF